MLVSQIETPALILDLDILERNIKTMQSFAAKRMLGLRPHYKSHKSTVIAHKQIDAGAKGLCCAKVGEALDLVNAGIEDILIANEVIDMAKIACVADLANKCRLTVCVDSAENVRDLSNAAALFGSKIFCLVEYNIGMDRCGVNSFEDVLTLAKLVDKLPNLAFEGIQAYAGHMAHEKDFAQRKEYSEKIDRHLHELKQYLEDNGLQVKEVSGASTGTSFLRPEDTVYTEIQPGSYIFMDASYNTLHLEFENSLFLLTTVISKNGERSICDLGAKCVGLDQEKPVLRDYPERLIKCNEEHCTISDGKDFKVGDKLYMIPGHCCTTVNLHDHIYFVREGKVVDRVPVTSRGKSM
ncbi:DSD1 family PLP-dependent enzyme [Synergistaceae bacterium OttesenSCG-928-D05]|nr:DSD1 family PLP-dependent enzyme [Synergistaceae bacterium OttesenSCG-928-D05]